MKNFVTKNKVTWREGVPVSVIYDDVYYSLESGLKESDYVFLKGNGLPERWLGMMDFTIFETGFGTGLNFFVTLDRWIQSGQVGKLHFISVEKYPLGKQEITESLANWPEISLYVKQFLNKYDPTQDFLEVDFSKWGVKLTIIFDDVNSVIEDLDYTIDAWFLDGFAPAKNPDMWTDKLFNHMARLSNKGTTFATFTSAGIVKRGLKAAGFNVEKVKGFGIKRDMLIGKNG